MHLRVAAVSLLCCTLSQRSQLLPECVRLRRSTVPWATPVATVLRTFGGRLFPESAGSGPNSEIRRVRSENSTIAVSGFVTFPDEMGRPATNKRVRTKPAAKPKDGTEKGAGKQPAKKKTASGGARVALNVPHVAADKPHEEGRAATVLDRAVLLPRHLVPLSVIGLAPSPRAHDMRMRMSICASPNGKTMRRCAPACVSWQRDQTLIRVADRGRCSPIAAITTN